MTDWISPAVTVIAGSTGMLGLFSLGAQWTERARLHTSVMRLREARDAVEPGSPAREAISIALERAVARYAVTEMIYTPPLTLIQQWTAAISVAFAVGGLILLFARDPSSLDRPYGIAVFVLQIVGCLIVVVTTTATVVLSRRRRRVWAAKLVESSNVKFDVRLMSANSVEFKRLEAEFGREPGEGETADQASNG